MNPQPEQDLRKWLESAGLYDALIVLHRQEHTGEDCFCTTEISGAYSKILSIFQPALTEAKRDMVENTFENLGMFTIPLSELAERLIDYQASICAYGTRDGDGKHCDCKFGATKIRGLIADEQCGCPELRLTARFISVLTKLTNEIAEDEPE